MKESQIKVLVVVTIVAGLVALVFNIIGRFTEPKVWTEPTPVAVPQDAKFNSPLPAIDDVFCQSHNCKG